MDDETIIYVSEEVDSKTKTIIDAFINQMDRLFDIHFTVKSFSAENEVPQTGIIFVKSILQNSSEGYELNIAKNNIIITASEAGGFLYAIQTLKQLLPKEIYANNSTTITSCELPCLEIIDSPRFGYRGLMIDVARHFYSVDQMKKIIDVMTVHKLNTLHWHLSDDQ